MTHTTKGARRHRANIERRNARSKLSNQQRDILIEISKRRQHAERNARRKQYRKPAKPNRHDPRRWRRTEAVYNPDHDPG